jgi:hypothetical protein
MITRLKEMIFVMRGIFRDFPNKVGYFSGIIACLGCIGLQMAHKYGYFWGKLTQNRNFKQINIVIMNRNMSNLDRILRLVVAVLFGVLYFTGTVGGTLGVVLVVIAVIFAGTSFVSFCPLYKLIGISTNKGGKQ